MDLEDPELPGIDFLHSFKQETFRKMDLEDLQLPEVDFLIVFN